MRKREEQSGHMNSYTSQVLITDWKPGPEVIELLCLFNLTEHELSTALKSEMLNNKDHSYSQMYSSC